MWFLVELAEKVDCNFDEDYCEWTRAPGSLSLQRYTGSTPLANTGPSYDHTWDNLLGAYAYLGE